MQKLFDELQLTCAEVGDTFSWQEKFDSSEIYVCVYKHASQRSYGLSLFYNTILENIMWLLPVSCSYQFGALYVLINSQAQLHSFFASG